MPKKKPIKGQPEVHESLQGFEIRINEFGEIISNVEIERLNEFLDKNAEDKKRTEKQEKGSEEPEDKDEKD